MTIVYVVKAGINLKPFFVQMTDENTLIDFSQLEIEDQYRNFPFQIELFIFNAEGICTHYLNEDSYSFRLKSDLKQMTDHALSANMSG